MLKKIITVSLISVSSLAIMTANAAIPADTSSQTTKSHKKYKKTSHHKNHHKNETAAATPARVLEATKANESYANAVSTERQGGLPAGLYVSGQVGYADTHISSKTQSPIAVGLKNDGLAGRLALGYTLNDHFAIEVGYLQLQQASFPQASDDGTLSNKQNAIDILGKASLAVTHNVNLYGKLGAAYLTTQLEENYNVAGKPATKNYNEVLGITRHTWAPEVAVGMGYDITPHVSVDTSFTHIHPLGSKRPGNVDYLAVGIGYTFG